MTHRRHYDCNTCRMQNLTLPQSAIPLSHRPTLSVAIGREGSYALPLTQAGVQQYVRSWAPSEIFNFPTILLNQVGGRLSRRWFPIGLTFSLGGPQLKGW